MDVGKLYSKNAMHEWRNLNIQDKKEVKNKILENTNYLCQQNLKDLSINCAETLSISNQIINSYNNELDVYLFNNSLFFINKEINGQECGKDVYKRQRVDVTKNQVKTTGDFNYVQQGTYYAYCHAWRRNAEGKKVFGEWSNIYPFSVSAITPAQPVITSVKAKGDVYKRQ